MAQSGKFAFFALTVELKEGINLAARDKTGNQRYRKILFILGGIIRESKTNGRPLECANFKSVRAVAHFTIEIYFGNIPC